MGGAPSTDTEIIRRRVSRSQSQRGTEEPPLIKWTLIAIALAFSLVFLLLPLVNVFAQAFAKGWQTYWNSLTEPDSWAAIRLTLIVAAIAVPLNVMRSEEHTSELQSQSNLVCRLLLEKKKINRQASQSPDHIV